VKRRCRASTSYTLTSLEQYFRPEIARTHFERSDQSNSQRLPVLERDALCMEPDLPGQAGRSTRANLESMKKQG
jgi:hypothetical protein